MSARRDYRLATSPLDREADGVELQAKRVYFLSVEGERTEVDYFRHLSVFLQREYPHFPFVIHVLRHRKDGLSSPGQVRGLLDECAELRRGELPLKELLKGLSKKYSERKLEQLFDDSESVSKAELKAFKCDLLKMGVVYDSLKYVRDVGRSRQKFNSQDVFAVVVDRDRGCHTPATMWELNKACNKRGYRLYLSNPCFEFWLLLHVADVAKCFSAAEKKKLLENEYVGAKTYAAYRLGPLAHHGKSISHPVFKARYARNLTKAISHSTAFPDDFKSLLKSIGTNLGGLAAEWLEGTRT